MYSTNYCYHIYYRKTVYRASQKRKAERNLVTTGETASSAKENGTHQSLPIQHFSVSPHKETDLQNQPNSPLQRKKALRRHI